MGNTNTAANPAAPASTAAALGAAGNTQAARERPRAGTGKRWICLEDCLLPDGFHYKDEMTEAAECPPHFGPPPDDPEGA
ncbi:MAG: hypothetical protein LBB77_04770 [Treponema sp.]|jgi:hypothetical protein|nr:hypothetical protein [Treponema sp.]